MRSSLDIINTILDGYTISSVMVPDPTLPSNQPAHDETYRFQHVFMDGERFWVQTNCAHRGVRNNSYHKATSSFFYSEGYKEQMMTYAAETNTLILGSIPARYAEFSWRLRSDYEQVWHSSQPEEVGKIRTAIKRGERFKVALLDEDGFWSVHPVDLINIEQDSPLFSVRTEVTNVPGFLPVKSSLLEAMESVCNARAFPEQMLQIEATPVPIYYFCLSDGTYYNYFDEVRSLFRNYGEMRLFATHERAVDIETVRYSSLTRAEKLNGDQT